jgi:hypothetical protein
MGASLLQLGPTFWIDKQLDASRALGTVLVPLLLFPSFHLQRG